MLIPCDEVNKLNTFRVMIILRLLLLLTNLHLKLLSTQGTGADKLLSTQRVNHMFNIVHGSAPEYLKNNINITREPAHNTRSGSFACYIPNVKS